MLTLVTVLVVLYLLLRRSYRIAVFVAGAIMGGWLLSTVLKLGVARPRPELVPHLVVVNDFSFPSGHAMLSAVTYLTLARAAVPLEQRRTLKMVFSPLTALLLMSLLDAVVCFSCPLSDGRDWWLGCWNGLGERQLVCIELVLCVQKMSLMVLIDKLSVADVGDGGHGIS